MIYHLSIGINVCMFFILLIFGFLFSLPLKLLLNTNYVTRINVSSKNDAAIDNNGRASDVITKIYSIDFQRLRLCENFDYKLTLKSVYFSAYDQNCTRIVKRNAAPRKKLSLHRNKTPKAKLLVENAGIKPSRFIDDSEKNLNTNQRKSISIAGHILAVMLVISAIAALVEVLRARLFLVKHPDGSGSTARRSSLVDLAQRRLVRKETVQAQKSFEIQGMMHRSPLRLLAARPPPLLRRSSFPAQCLSKKDVTVTSTTTIGRLSRRPSFIVDSDEDPNNGLTDFKRHSRLIRRH